MKIDILNIVIGCPDTPWSAVRGDQAPRELASFYSELLGMPIIREDWVRIAEDERSLPRLAFDDPSGDPPPRWPDPEHPQQLHLDITVHDLSTAEALVLRRGATRLQDAGGYRSYADPVGHPFCLYRDAAGGGVEPETAGPGRLQRVVFDCFSPRALASFYQELLGMRRREQDSPQCVVIARANGEVPMLAFQHAPQFKAPRWPNPEHPQQIHLDYDVEDGDAARQLAEGLGAIPLAGMGGSCPVYADPAAHPFCLCAPDQ
jgi:hypothetical protein